MVDDIPNQILSCHFLINQFAIAAANSSRLTAEELVPVGEPQRFPVAMAGGVGEAMPATGRWSVLAG